MGEKERAQALHAIMVLSLEIGQRGGLAAPIVAQAQKVLDVNNKHREEAESHIRSARNGGDWQGQRGSVVRQAMKRVSDAIEYGDLPPGRKSKDFRRLVERAKKVLEKAGEASDFMNADTDAPLGMGSLESVPERRVQPAAVMGDDNLLDSLLDEHEESEEGSLIATLMDDDPSEDEGVDTEPEGKGLRLAPVAGGSEPMSHMDGSEAEEQAYAQVMEPAVGQTSTEVEEVQVEEVEDEDDPAHQLLALQKQVAELTKAIRHEGEMEEGVDEEEFIEEEFVEEEFIEENIPETRMRRTRRASSLAPMATKDTTVRTPGRASISRRAMSAAPVASSKSRRAQVEEEEEEEEEEGGRRSSTLDTYRLLLETVWVDDLLDPAEVDLLRRKRVELGIDFETHLKMTREMLGGLE